MSKCLLIRYSQILAAELGERARVNSMCPGFVDTDMTRQAPPGSKLGGSPRRRASDQRSALGQTDSATGLVAAALGILLLPLPRPQSLQLLQRLLRLMLLPCIVAYIAAVLLPIMG